jgi:hypothetical protein
MRDGALDLTHFGELKNSVRVRAEWPWWFEAFGVGIVMCGADLHIPTFRILDLAFNPALK